MPVHPIPATLNRTLLLLFILMMAAATVMAVHEIFSRSRNVLTVLRIA